MKLNNDLSSITKDMQPNERTKILRRIRINVVYNDNKIFYLNDEFVNRINNQTISTTRKELRLFADKLNACREYLNIGNTHIGAYFSKNNLNESISKSSDISCMFYVLFNFVEILNNSVKIEEHIDIKEDVNIKLIHEYISILSYKKDKYIIIKITVKETTNSEINNILYSITNLDKIKKATSNALSTSKSNNLGAHSTSRLPSTLSLTQIIKSVNNPDILRYIPDDLLSETQKLSKRLAKIEYNYKKLYQIINKKE